MLVHDIVDFAARRTPDETALAFEGRRWSFAELASWIERLSGGMSARWPVGARVGVLAHNRPEYVATLYAASRAGLGLVPLNQRLHPSEWETAIDRARPDVVIGDAALLGSLGDRGGPTIAFEELGSLERDHAAPRPPNASSALAWLVFTSGTTGRPKGVIVTHDSLLAAMTNTAIGRPVAPSDVYLFPFPLCHIAAYNVLNHHLHGRPVVLLERFEPAAAVDAIRAHAVTSMSLAPTMIAALLDRLDAAAHRQAAAGDERVLRAAGRPGPLASIRIVDDDGRELPTGDLGEIVVRGPQVTTGYWEDEAATRDAFVDGWFRTGDLGRIEPDGLLFVVDRRKDMIVSGGENIASREVEDVLRRHPAVRDVAVVGVPDERWGEAVCAAVVASAAVEPRELIELSRSHLASYKKPRHVVFVDELPRNAAGKILKREVQQSVSAQLDPGREPLPPPG